MAEISQGQTIKEYIPDGDEEDVDMKKRLLRTIPLVLLATVLICLFGGVHAKGIIPATAKAKENARTGEKVYFAAPLFSEAEREYNLKIVGILERHGYEVFLPQRDGFLAPELEGLTEEEKTEKIF